MNFSKKEKFQEKKMSVFFLKIILSHAMESTKWYILHISTELFVSERVFQLQYKVYGVVFVFEKWVKLFKKMKKKLKNCVFLKSSPNLKHKVIYFACSKA